MLTIIATANSQYSRAMAHLLEARANCSELVARIDNHKSGIASVGGITNVRNAIDAAGSPIPKKPFTTAANRKITTSSAVCCASRFSNMARLFVSRWVTFAGVLRDLQVIFKTENRVVI